MRAFLCFVAIYLLGPRELSGSVVAQQIHDHCAQELKQGGSLAVGVAVRVLVHLGIPRPVPLVFNTPALAD